MKRKSWADTNEFSATAGASLNCNRFGTWHAKVAAVALAVTLDVVE